MFALIAIVGTLVSLWPAWQADAPPMAEPQPGLAMAAAALPPSAAGIDAPPAAVRQAVPAVRPAVAPTARAWTSRRQEFERGDDLFDFVRRLQPAADAGDAEARWLVSRANEYCAGYARAPADYERDTALIEQLDLDAARPLGQARSRVASRCMRYVPTDPVTFVQLVAQREDAALAGSLAAEASLLAMGEPLIDDEPYRTELVERVQASRDPDAYAALAPAMGLAAANDAALAGHVAGTQAAELAWQLAACRLGLDCSQSGVLMTTYCANGGICARDARKDFSSFVRDAALSPRDADEVEKLVDELVRGPDVGMVMR